MAGGKVSARQKMINLMYLVFIAMMAMNMSKEVLTAFGLMDAKFSREGGAFDGSQVLTWRKIWWKYLLGYLLKL